MIVIGLTGALASGKTQAALFFKQLGAKVFDADKSAKKALKKGTAAYKAAVKLFGRNFLLPSGEFNRKKLAQHVFNNTDDLKKLNTLLHPGVIFESLAFAKRLRHKKGIAVMDVPLLFESKMEGLCDVTIVVSAKRATILKRADLRGIKPSLAKKILASQWSLAKKEKLADFVICADGTLDELKKKVEAIFLKIQKSNF